MKQWLVTLLLLAFVGFLLAGFYVLHKGHPLNTVTLPILVYAEDGTNEHVESVMLHTSSPGGVDRLYVQAHQPFYHRGGVQQSVSEGFDQEGAASIRVNGGAWVDVRDENVTCAFPESEYDCVAGGYSTIRFALPVSGIQSGPNTVEFRFNGTDGIRSGYRVLELGLMRGSDDLQDFDPGTDGAVDGTAFVYEDPADWAPSLPGASDLAKGKELFTKENSLVADGASQASIKAACSSCHAKEGRDLKYFGFSDRVIEARSRYHGLSEKEAQQIASYIRSIPLEKANGQTYEAPGRPWNPPYQPGPELEATGESPDVSDQVYWASGAGLDGVLDHDEEMLPYLFPDGHGGVDRLPSGSLNWHHLSMDSTLNMREVPISLQFPDWNNWLPDIHPMDAYPSKFDGGVMQSRYEGPLQDQLAERDLSGTDRAFKRVHMGFRDDGFHKSDYPDGLIGSRKLSDQEWALAKLSAYQWMAIKGWESFHTHHLEDVADEMYCNNNKKPFCEPRSWMGRARTLFDLAPHLSSVNGWRNAPYAYGSRRMNNLLSHVWYQLQVTVNPGASPGSSTQNPVDWNYQRMFLRGAPGSAGVGAGLRMVASEIKKMQLLSNGYGVDGTGGEGYHRTGFVRGWTPFTASPVMLMSMHETGSSKSGLLYKNLSSALRDDLLEASLRTWHDYNSRFPIDAFPRAPGNKRYDPSDHVQNMGEWTGSREHGQRIYQALPKIRDRMSVAPGILDSIATWGGQMWPHTVNPAWDELIEGEEVPQDPRARVTNLTKGDTFTAPVDLTIEVDAYDAEGENVSTVSFFASDTELGEDSSAPYSFTWQNVPPGQHVLTARATDSQGRTGSSAPVTITVEEAPTTSQRIPLDEGWNFISSSVQPQATSLDSVFAEIPTLTTMQDEAGQTYVPGNPGNALTEWSPHESYLVFMQEADTLEVTGPSAPSETTPITLHEGWNFVPYPYEQTVSPEEAFASITDALVRVRDEVGNEYLPAYDLDEIGLLQPGQGYKVYVSQEASLVYPGMQ